jgi:hypothetical protein
METNALTNNSSSENILTWWNNLNFEDKNCFTINENGELFNQYFNNQFIITKLNVVNGDEVIKHLISKFDEIKKSVQRLEEEWMNQTDKFKLQHKINKLSQSFSTSNAIGNFEPLVQVINRFNAELIKISDDHYQSKLSLLEKVKSIKFDANTWREDAQLLKGISDEWKTIGYIEKEKNDTLWNTFKEIKESFQTAKNEYFESKEKDLLNNLDIKIELIEKAEALASSDDWKNTTEAYKNLFEIWKNTGRTIQEKNEALWQRFNQAMNTFYERKKNHYESIKSEQEENLKLKLVIVEKAELLKDSKDWNITTEAYNQLNDAWKNIGHVPIEVSKDLRDRFNAAKDFFFDEKRAYSQTVRDALNENLLKKQQIINRAEAIKNIQNDWNGITIEMNQLMDEWKKIGFAGKEHNENLWEQFLNARKHFFNKKDQHRAKRKQEYEKNRKNHLKQARAYLDLLIAENAEDKAKIEEFSANAQQVETGPKAAELKTHLEKLVHSLHSQIENRSQQIEKVQKQVDQLEIEIEEQGDKNNTIK